MVEIRGLDVYDPTTGVVRTSSVDDIAAWFLDTDYDGNAFFVRHAYFTGADDPYDRLRKALGADIFDEAWAPMNLIVSRPFPRPKRGKVAVKVINHYGDEVMRVLPLLITDKPDPHQRSVLRTIRSADLPQFVDFGEQGYARCVSCQRQLTREEIRLPEALQNARMGAYTARL